MTRPIFIFYFVFLSLFSFSQESIIFNRITKEDGLSASWVRSIYQDKYGFMWFGTSDGLNRYDGYEIKEYKPNDKDPFAISNGAIMFISERDDGKLWVCTEKGVNIFDIDHGKFSEFRLLKNVRVNGVLKDHENILWFASASGLFRYDPVIETMVNFINDPNDKATISNNSIESIFEDSSYNLWIGTRKGLNVLIRKDQSFKYYTHSDNPKSIGGDFVSPVLEDMMGRLWVGNNENGLDLFVNAKDLPDEGIFEHIIPGSVNKSMIDRKNRLWIAQGHGFGLQVINLNTFSLEKENIIPNYNNIPYNDRSLGDNSVSSFFEDRDGGVWVGTYSNGVSYTSSRMKKFHSVEPIPGDIKSLSDNFVNFFLEEDAYLWIATEFGLSRLDKKTNLYKNYYSDPDDPNTIGQNGVICLYEDSYNNIWVGTWNGGLNLYNRDKDNFTRFLPIQGKKGTISSFNVFAIMQDSKGILWVGTNGGGLNRYDYLTGKFTQYMHDRNDSTTIFHNAINDICPTANGELYISAYHSLDLFDYSTGTFKHYRYNDQDTTGITDGNILDVFEDSRQNLWVCTTRGLNYFNREKEIFIHYTKEDGLPSNAIQSILEDGNGNLWLGTNNGISKFIKGTEVPDDPEFVNYSSNDGLQGSEFVRRSALLSRDGRMYFGGSNGYTYFHPDSIVENPVPPELVFVDFRLFEDHNNEEISKILSGKDVNMVERMVLSYDQADFTINYAALNYLNSKENEYQFKLDGYENEWHNVGYQRSATYTNLEHGKYTFMVRGSNNDGVWSKKIKMLTIIIKPPWWKTIVFRVFAIALLITIILVFYKIRFKLLEKQKHLLEKMVRERTTELSEVNSLLEERQEEISLQNEELEKHRNHLEQLVEKRTEQLEEARKYAEASDKLKSAFLANMSHEIRTPMNAIVGFASMLKEEDIPGEEKEEFIDIINSNSQSLLVLINDILEISLIEANQLILSKDPFDSIHILQELESYFVMKNTKKIDIHFNNKDNRRILIFQNDKTRFRQVVSNLISNSYKYTEEGSIEFGYKILDKEVEFYVSDTGIGINENEYQRIFDYFHKIDKGDNKLYRGAGIGLSICNKLVELMGGRIYLDSNVGKGTTFYFTLPFVETEEKSIIISKPPSKVKYNLKGVTILVAEDEITNYQLLKRILKPTKATVLWAKNGEEAVNMVREISNFNNFIVLMDIKMPLMNGITANEEIQKINKEIPVIAVTAYAQAKDKEEILKHNFIDYIAKPLESEKLLEAIAKHLKK